MSPTPGPELLNDHQRRHLAVTLSQIQRLLGEVNVMLQSPARRNGMETELDDIPEGFAEEAVPRIEDLNARIAELAARFDLPGREQSRYRWVRAVLGMAIDNLEDTRSRALRAYGTVHPDLPAALDPALGDLQHRLQLLLAMLEAERSHRDAG